MAITIKRAATAHCLNARDIQDGHAYEREDGVLFVGNCIGNVVAFSLCGDDVVNFDSASMFRSVDLIIEVVG